MTWIEQFVISRREEISSVVRIAPWSGFIFAIVCFGANFTLFELFDGKEIASLKSTARSEDLELSDYRTKLHVSTPYEAEQKVSELQKKLVEKIDADYPIFDKFKSAARTRPELGKPIDISRTTDSAGQYWHQNAVVFWIHATSKFYVAFRNANTPPRSWEDKFWDRDPKWTNEKKLAQIFPPPKGFLPPYGGIALHWIDYGWNKILGWRTDDGCVIFYNKIHFQEFEHGIIMGPFHKGVGMEEGEDIVFVEGKAWDAITSVDHAAACVN